MITPTYTGFYKPGLKTKAAELSLRPIAADEQESTAPDETATANKAGYIQLMQKTEQRVERRAASEARPIAA